MKTGGGTKTTLVSIIISMLCLQTKAYPEHLIFVSVEHMRHETSVCSKPLASKHASKALLFGHVSHMISSGIHDDVSICLLKSSVGPESLSN
jgi:hypothetical protein